MKIQLKEIKFDRDKKGKVIFSNQNLQKLYKYVIPIIEKNRGWSTEELTLENFRENPEIWRDDINATVEVGIKAKVIIALDNGKPIGLLEYIPGNFENLSNKKFVEVLKEMLEDLESEYWKRLTSYSFLSTNVVQQHFSKLRSHIYSRQLYKYVGVVLIPELQGKKSGVSDLLYKSMKNGFLLGSTSTPQVLAKRRKLFRETIYTPILSQKIKTLDELACLLIIAVMFFSRDDYKTQPENQFGIETHVGSALRDKEEYMKLADSFLEKGKITELDYKRLDTILDTKKAQGAIVSIS